MSTEATDGARVCVVMVTFGAPEWVERALDAVEANTPSDRYELVVVDNGGPDPRTREALRRRYGGGWEASEARARVVVHEAGANLGFAGGNDLAVNLASAPYVCLLNSDAIVPSGWLDPLLAPLHDPTVGAVVPVLCELDGRVQEAGANIEPDGRVEAFDQGSDPSSLPRSVQRVPYGSAACMVVRTADYRSVGGLDCGYGLGYYEDADLACELLRRGLHTVLVPSVRVVHARGASVPDHGESLERARRNQQRFVDRQSAVLAHRWHTLDASAQPHRVTAARDATAPRRALAVAGDVSDVERLLRDHDVVTVAGTFGTEPPVTRPGIEAAGDAVAVCAARPFHYDTVVASVAWLRDHAALLDETQPAARRVPR